MEYKNKNAIEDNPLEIIEPTQMINNNPVMTIDEENNIVETNEDSEDVENNLQESFTDTNAQEEIITTKRINPDNWLTMDCT